MTVEEALTSDLFLGTDDVMIVSKNFGYRLALGKWNKDTILQYSKWKVTNLKWECKVKDQPNCLTLWVDK